METAIPCRLLCQTIDHCTISMCRDGFVGSCLVGLGIARNKSGRRHSARVIHPNLARVYPILLPLSSRANRINSSAIHCCASISIDRPSMSFLGSASVSMPSRHLTFTAQPSNCSAVPSLSSLVVGSLGRRNGKIPQVRQK